MSIRRWGLINFPLQVQEQASQAGDNSHRFPSHHDYRINDQTWLNGLAYQQLALRFSQINQNLNEVNATCTHLQKNLDARKEELKEVKERYGVADTSLKYEFKCHKEQRKA